MTKFPLRPLAVAAVVAIVVAAIGGLATDTGAWYQRLEKPPLQPPDGVFGPVWTVLYALIAISAALAWQAARNREERRRVVLLYGVNALLNLGWTLLFFGARLPLLALVEIIVLWIQILVIILYVRRLSGWAAVLLVPYLAWVGFATYLNLEIVRRNPAEREAAGAAIVAGGSAVAAEVRPQPRAPATASAALISSGALIPFRSSSAAFTARSASPLV